MKTGNERDVPLLPEVVAVLKWVIGDRRSGPVLRRKRFSGVSPQLVGDREQLERACRERGEAAERVLSRAEEAQVARCVGRDDGAINPDAVRTSFIEVTRAIGHAQATCPKSWRHSFATLLQDANVDPLILQQPTADDRLGPGGNRQ